MNETPRQILETLFEPLVTASGYAAFLQHKVEALEEKSEAKNLFAAALSDADLSVQTSIEVALLAKLPGIPFFGEEWKSSRNTKYLPGTTFIDSTPYLVTLDPIDGTRPYLDGSSNYQIILTVLTKQAMQAALVLFPVHKEYVFAIRGEGAFKGTFDTPLTAAKPLRLSKSESRVYVSEELVSLRDELKKHFQIVESSADYKKGVEFKYVNSALLGELQGAILASAQIIDGAALTFIAQEMGYKVTHLDGSTFLGSWENPDHFLPGVIIGESDDVYGVLKQALQSKDQ